MNEDLPRASHPHSRGECERARLHASAWIDGELADESPLRAHLARCDECRAFVAELRALPALLSPLRHGGPELDRWPRILERARVSRARPAPVRDARVARFAAVFVGFVATASMLRAVSARREGPAPLRDARTATWAAVLHPELPELRRLEATPEQRLLAALSAEREVSR